MTTEVTNKQLVEIFAALNYLASLDTPAWYQISRNIKKIESPIAELNTLRTEIVNKFVNKDEKGQPIYLNEAKTMLDLGENQAEADKLWVELQNEKVEIDFFQFNYELLKDVKISGSRIMSLLDIIIID